jgi:5-methylcytosine-specific restriction endonuclease McrA
MKMLTNRVLVVNQNYEPLIVTSVKRAIVMMYLGKATVVESRNGRRIRAVSRAFEEPSIVRLDFYARVPYRQVMLNRKNVIKRDGGRCQYCGTSSGVMTVDHVVPKLRGGGDIWENLVCACDRCNNRKGNRTPDQAGMRLLSSPRKPSHLTFIRQSIGKGDEVWNKYLFFD